MSSDKVSRFPYPFSSDVYRYSNNSLLLDPPIAIEVTPEYADEITLKRKLLADCHSRCYQSLPHTLQAQWEVVSVVLHHLAETYPASFTLDKKENLWTFTNQILNETATFTFGDAGTLPIEPLDFVGRHVQEDLIVMGQRDNDLFLDAGQLCFPANWSLQFNLGMNFVEIHTPIPGFSADRLDEKIRNFIMRLENGQPWVRRNWSLNAGHKLDSSLETFHLWGQKRKEITAENAGQEVYLRVEVQKLFRLPRTHAVLFTIHTHLISLQELSLNRDYAKQLYHVLVELPDFIADYKGMKLFRGQTINYLHNLFNEAGC
ncbi:UNVERIFIED_CONTAM: hypothetical protein ABID98_001528 [Brevibacillus sp. OAP136]